MQSKTIYQVSNTGLNCPRFCNYDNNYYLSVSPEIIGMTLWDYCWHPLIYFENSVNSSCVNLPSVIYE